MKKIFISIAIAAAIISAFSPRASAAGISRSFLLPGDPFYFIKEIGRNIQRTLIVDPVSKAELEVEIMSSLISEVVSLDSKELRDENAVRSSISRYADGVAGLKARLTDADMKAGDKNVLRFSDGLIEKLVLHDRVFSELMKRDKDAGNEIEGARSAITDVLIVTSEKYPSSRDFSARVMSSVSSADGAGEKISAMELLIRLDEKLSDESTREMTPVMSELVARLEGDIIADGSTLSGISGMLFGITDPSMRIRIADEMIGRMSDTAAMSRIQGVKAETIKLASERSEIDPLTADREMGRARRMISFYQTLSSDTSDVIPYMKESMKKAEEAYSSKRYVDAYDLAVLTEIIGDQGFSRRSLDDEAIAGEFAKLKSEYERLIGLAEERGFDKPIAPALWGKISAVKEKMDGPMSYGSLMAVRTALSDISASIEKISKETPIDPSKPKFCPTLYDPVCGIDGKTYQNSCVAKSSGITVKTKGECAATVLPNEGRVCIMIYDPVCGEDGKTYSNSCEAYDVRIAHKGVCK